MTVKQTKIYPHNRVIFFLQWSNHPDMWGRSTFSYALISTWLLYAFVYFFWNSRSHGFVSLFLFPLVSLDRTSFMNFGWFIFWMKRLDYWAGCWKWISLVTSIVKSCQSFSINEIIPSLCFNYLYLNRGVNMVKTNLHSRWLKYWSKTLDQFRALFPNTKLCSFTWFKYKIF